VVLCNQEALETRYSLTQKARYRAFCRWARTAIFGKEVQDVEISTLDTQEDDQSEDVVANEAMDISTTSNGKSSTAENLLTKTFGDQKIRMVEKDSEIWLVAKDLCAALSLGNSREAVNRLEDDERGVSTIDTRGGPQEMTVINEPGAYRLIFTSRKEAAEKFKRWLAHEVIPSIRKHGGYVEKTTQQKMVELLVNQNSNHRKLQEQVEELVRKIDGIDIEAQTTEEKLKDRFWELAQDCAESRGGAFDIAPGLHRRATVVTTRRT